MKAITKTSRNLVILLCCLLGSCGTAKKVVYIQDASTGVSKATVTQSSIVIQPKDILSISVSSRTPELVVGFNLPLQQYYAGSSSMATGYTQRQLGYHVSVDGIIDFPILGRLQVAGLTREEVSNMIKQRLLQESLLMDAIVITEFLNFKITVLGEVRSPGTFSLSDDRVTILEALSRAGDLTLYARRDNVLVRRERDGRVVFYRVDLRTENLLTSPAYYLQQNDVVYVEPNSTMVARSRINENRTLGAWTSVMGLLLSVTNIIILLNK